MQLSRPPSPMATNQVPALAERRNDPVLPAILEFQSPSTAIVSAPVPRSVRHTVWVITSLFIALIAALGLIKVDQVVTAQAVVVPKAPAQRVQPLETAIVRSIDVHEGQTVHAGQLLARLDSTFAAADLGSLMAKISSLQPMVGRLQAEANDQSFKYTGSDPNMLLQAAIYGQRKAQYNYQLEDYDQKANSLIATIARAKADEVSYRERLAMAVRIETMRKELQKFQVGSALNTWQAVDYRTEMDRLLLDAEQTAAGSGRDLAALYATRNGFIQKWHADVGDDLAKNAKELADDRAQLKKQQLKRQLVVLKADQDAYVLKIAKVSVGSVMQSGQEFIQLVPIAGPMEVEANIRGDENGYVHVGDGVMIKFDTLSYITYGMAYGTVRVDSANSFTSEDDQTAARPLPVDTTYPYYRARITIDKTELHNTPPGFKLEPGMPVTADIKVGKRSLLQYLLSRVLSPMEEGMREPQL